MGEAQAQIGDGKPDRLVAEVERGECPPPVTRPGTASMSITAIASTFDLPGRRSILQRVEKRGGTPR